MCSSVYTGPYQCVYAVVSYFKKYILEQRLASTQYSVPSHMCTYCHGEIRVGQVVVEDIPDHLVEHGEEGAHCSEPGEVHDVVQALCVL